MIPLADDPRRYCTRTFCRGSIHGIVRTLFCIHMKLIRNQSVDSIHVTLLATLMRIIHDEPLWKSSVVDSCFESSCNEEVCLSTSSLLPSCMRIKESLLFLMTVVQVKMPLCDIARMRAETPGTGHVIHLNNTGASLMPGNVCRIMQKYLDDETNFGGYEMEDKYASEYEKVYPLLAQLLNCKSNEIAITDSATTAWDRALYALPFQRGDKILTSTTEYASHFNQSHSYQWRISQSSWYLIDALLVSERMLEFLEPNSPDLHSAKWKTKTDYEFRKVAWMFEITECNVAAKLGLTYALQNTLDLGWRTAGTNLEKSTVHDRSYSRGKI